MRKISKLFVGKFNLILACILFSILLSFDGIGGPYFLGRFTDFLTVGDYVSGTWTTVQWLAFLMLIALSQALQRYFLAKIRTQVRIELKVQELTKASARPRLGAASGYLASITTEVTQIDERIVASLLTFVYCLLQTAVTFSFLMMLDVPVGLIFVGLGFIPVLVPRLSAKWLKEATVNWQGENQRFVNQLDDFLKGRKLLSRFQALLPGQTRVMSQLNHSESAYLQMELKQQIANTLVSLLYVGALLLGLLLGIQSVMAGRLTVGALITIYMAADRVISPLMTCIQLYNNMSATQPLLDKIMQPVQAEKSHLELVRGEKQALIQVQDGTVGYPNRPLIKGLNLQLNLGEKVLLQAPSGSGKSTLIQTLMGEIPLLEGKVSLNRDALPSNEGSWFGMVEQAPFVFNLTLGENLSLGLDYRSEEMEMVLQAVGLAKFANPESLAGVLGGDQQILSGGELKRLEVARALLFKKPILLVDEALSGLDAQAAKALNQVLRQYPGLVIDIEHHITPDLISQYDRVLTIRDGYLEEIRE